MASDEFVPTYVQAQRHTVHIKKCLYNSNATNELSELDDAQRQCSLILKLTNVPTLLTPSSISVGGRGPFDFVSTTSMDGCGTAGGDESTTYAPAMMLDEVLQNIHLPSPHLCKSKSKRVFNVILHNLLNQHKDEYFIPEQSLVLRGPLHALSQRMSVFGVCAQPSIDHVVPTSTLNYNVVTYTGSTLGVNTNARIPNKSTLFTLPLSQLRESALFDKFALWLGVAPYPDTFPGDRNLSGQDAIYHELVKKESFTQNGVCVECFNTNCTCPKQLYVSSNPYCLVYIVAPVTERAAHVVQFLKHLNERNVNRKVLISEQYRELMVCKIGEFQEIQEGHDNKSLIWYEIPDLILCGSQKWKHDIFLVKPNLNQVAMNQFYDHNQITDKTIKDVRTNATTVVSDHMKNQINYYVNTVTKKIDNLLKTVEDTKTNVKKMTESFSTGQYLSDSVEAYEKNMAEHRKLPIKLEMNEWYYTAPVSKYLARIKITQDAMKNTFQRLSNHLQNARNELFQLDENPTTIRTTMYFENVEDCAKNANELLNLLKLIDKCLKLSDLAVMFTELCTLMMTLMERQYVERYYNKYDPQEKVTLVSSVKVLESKISKIQHQMLEKLEVFNAYSKVHQITRELMASVESIETATSTISQAPNDDTDFETTDVTILIKHLAKFIQMNFLKDINMTTFLKYLSTQTDLELAPLSPHWPLPNELRENIHKLMQTWKKYRRQTATLDSLTEADDKVINPLPSILATAFPKETPVSEVLPNSDRVIRKINNLQSRLVENDAKTASLQVQLQKLNESITKQGELKLALESKLEAENAKVNSDEVNNIWRDFQSLCHKFPFDLSEMLRYFKTMAYQVYKLPYDLIIPQLRVLSYVIKNSPRHLSIGAKKYAPPEMICKPYPKAAELDTILCSFYTEMFRLYAGTSKWPKPNTADVSNFFDKFNLKILMESSQLTVPNIFEVLDKTKLVNIMSKQVNVIGNILDIMESGFKNYINHFGKKWKTINYHRDQLEGFLQMLKERYIEVSENLITKMTSVKTNTMDQQHLVDVKIEELTRFHDSLVNSKLYSTMKSLTTFFNNTMEECHTLMKESQRALILIEGVKNSQPNQPCTFTLQDQQIYIQEAATYIWQNLFNEKSIFEKLHIIFKNAMKDHYFITSQDNVIVNYFASPQSVVESLDNIWTSAIDLSPALLPEVNNLVQIYRSERRYHEGLLRALEHEIDSVSKYGTSDHTTAAMKILKNKEVKYREKLEKLNTVFESESGDLTYIEVAKSVVRDSNKPISTLVFAGIDAIKIGHYKVLQLVWDTLQKSVMSSVNTTQNLPDNELIQTEKQPSDTTSQGTNSPSAILFVATIDNTSSSNH